jgi:putative FmdB family regulatory protein
MPIYEYECRKCGPFEVTQRITDKNLTKCPTCKSKVKKLISNTSFQLKGTGWYVTDYARKGQTNGEAKSSATSESNGEAKKTEAKKNEKPSGKSDKSSSTTTPAST